MSTQQLTPERKFAVFSASVESIMNQTPSTDQFKNFDTNVSDRETYQTKKQILETKLSQYKKAKKNIKDLLIKFYREVTPDHTNTDDFLLANFTQNDYDTSIIGSTIKNSITNRALKSRIATLLNEIRTYYRDISKIIDNDINGTFTGALARLSRSQTKRSGKQTGHQLIYTVQQEGGKVISSLARIAARTAGKFSGGVKQKKQKVIKDPWKIPFTNYYWVWDDSNEHIFPFQNVSDEDIRANIDHAQHMANIIKNERIKLSKDLTEFIQNWKNQHPRMQSQIQTQINEVKKNLDALQKNETNLQKKVKQAKQEQKIKSLLEYAPSIRDIQDIQKRLQEVNNKIQSLTQKQNRTQDQQAKKLQLQGQKQILQKLKGSDAALSRIRNRQRMRRQLQESAKTTEQPTQLVRKGAGNVGGATEQQSKPIQSKQSVQPKAGNVGGTSSDLFKGIGEGIRNYAKGAVDAGTRAVDAFWSEKR